MLTIPNVTPEIEEQRLLALYSYDILGDGLEHELDNLVKLAAQIVQAPIAYMSLVDRADVVLKSVFGYNFSPQHQLPRSNDIISQFTMWSEKPFLVPDTLLDPELVNNPMVVNDPHIRFYCSVPLKDNQGLPIGCLTLLDVKPRNFTANELEALETVAVQIISQLVLKRKNADLIAQAKKFDEFIEIFTVSPEIHGILDRNGNILFINEEVTSMLAYSVDEVIGESIWQYCYKDDANKTLLAVENSLRSGNKHFSLDFRLVSKNGLVKWVAWGMVAKGDRWYCYGSDITERKRMWRAS